MLLVLLLQLQQEALEHCFWLVDSFFGAVTKFTEVIFAMDFRSKLKTGNVIGGPNTIPKKK